MFHKLFIVFALVLMTSANAEVSSCEGLIQSDKFLKVDLQRCVNPLKKISKELSVDDSLRTSGKDIKNNRAPSVEVFYRRSSRQ